MEEDCEIEKISEDVHLVPKRTEEGTKVVESKSYWFKCKTHRRKINSSTKDVESCLINSFDSSSLSKQNVEGEE